MNAKYSVKPNAYPIFEEIERNGKTIHQRQVSLSHNLQDAMLRLDAWREEEQNEEQDETAPTILHRAELVVALDYGSHTVVRWIKVF